MASDVNLVGSRIPMMHVGYDCPKCTKSVTVTMIDGGRDSEGNRRVVQQPRDCPNCGEKIQISLVAEPIPGDRAAR
jgi:ribosomal protein S27AE